MTETKIQEAKVIKFAIAFDVILILIALYFFFFGNLEQYAKDLALKVILIITAGTIITTLVLKTKLK